MNFLKLSHKKCFIFPLLLFILGVSGLLLASCAPAGAPVAQIPLPTPLLTKSVAVSPIPTPRATRTPPDPTAVPPNLTATPTPVYLDALTWDSEPVVPIILYHRFIPDFNKESSKTKLRLGDFRQQLQSFYDSGYSLVPLDRWLKGDLSAPAGRRPLILTMDDAFFADQIFIDPDGSPSPKSGIGVLWQFSREHPDFGFSAALFSNLGDKLYANLDNGSDFINEGNWKPSLANAIEWGILHGVMPYNHLYHHPRLDLTDGKYISLEMRSNDTNLDKLLTLVHRDDLIPQIDNIIALPYSIWPPSPDGKKLIINYHNPLGQPLLAVLEAGYYHDTNTLAYSPFSPHFERYHIPRITMNTLKAVDYLVSNRQQIPIAGHCRLGPIDPSRPMDAVQLKVWIKNAIQSGDCRAGYYLVNGLYFDASAATVEWAQMAPVGQ